MAQFSNFNGKKFFFTLTFQKFEIFHNFKNFNVLLSQFFQKLLKHIPKISLEFSDFIFKILKIFFQFLSEIIFFSFQILYLIYSNFLKII